MRTWAVLDFETTGIDTPMVVEIALVDPMGTVLLSMLVNPGIPIPERVQAFHGIDDAMVEGAPKWAEAQEMLRDTIEHYGVDVVVAYNAAFESRCLACNARSAGVQPLRPKMKCAYLLADRLLEGLKPPGSGSLAEACERMGVETVPSHRAVSDCRATADLVIALTGPDVDGW